MTTARNELLHALRDAHAMEAQAETMLKRQARRLEHYPQLRARVERHIEETQSQSQRVGRCLELMDESPSAIKDSGARAMAFAQSLTGMAADDEVLKGLIASYAFEHMEIASYRMLISMARSCDEQEIERICEQILPEETAMASWLEQHMVEFTEIFMQRLGGTIASRATTDRDAGAEARR